jgi:ABC-type sulfate transport system permease subunit
MGELIPIVAIFFTIGVPGMALATHFVLRPMVRDIIEAMRGGAKDEVAALQSHVFELQEIVTRQEEQIAVLAEAESFRRQLEAKSS